MTDNIQVTNTGTQTALPKSGSSLTNYLKNIDTIPNANFDTIKRNELCLLKQINEIKKIDERLRNKSKDSHNYINNNNGRNNNSHNEDGKGMGKELLEESEECDDGDIDSKLV